MSNKKPVAIALGTALAGGLVLSGSAFAMQPLAQGYLLSAQDAGKAAMASFDPKATAQKDCIPVGVPNLMLYAVADTITVQRDRVVMKVD